MSFSSIFRVLWEHIWTLLLETSLKSVPNVLLVSKLQVVTEYYQDDQLMFPCTKIIKAYRGRRCHLFCYMLKHIPVLSALFNLQRQRKS